MGALIAEWVQRNRRLLGGLVGLLVALVLLARLRGGLTPVILGVLLAYVFTPSVNALTKRGLPRIWAIVGVYLAFIALIAATIGWLVPRVAVELARLAEFVPGYFTTVQQWLQELQERYSQAQLPESVRQAFDSAFASLQSRLLGLVSVAFNQLVGIFSAAANFVVGVVLSFYMVRDAECIRAGVGRLIRPAERQQSLGLLADVDQVIAGFVRGQLTVAFIVGVMVMVGLNLLGVRFALILGILAGLTNVIPYFGAVIGAVPALAVAVIDSPILALKVLVLFLAVQQVESNLISPRVIAKSVGLHPLAVVLSLLAGFELFGILGMVAAVPVAGVVRLLLDRWLAERDRYLEPCPPETASVPLAARPGPGDGGAEAVPGGVQAGTLPEPARPAAGIASGGELPEDAGHEAKPRVE